jgi:hypothetical protein
MSGEAKDDGFRTLPQAVCVSDLIRAAKAALPVITDKALHDKIERAVRVFDTCTVLTAWDQEDVASVWGGEVEPREEQVREVLERYSRDHETTDSDWMRLSHAVDSVKRAADKAA